MHTHMFYQESMKREGRKEKRNESEREKSLPTNSKQRICLKGRERTYRKSMNSGLKSGLEKPKMRKKPEMLQHSFRGWVVVKSERKLKKRKKEGERERKGVYRSEIR